MMFDRTANQKAAVSFINGHNVGHNTGVKKATSSFAKQIRPVIEKLHWFCGKHRECDDSMHFCLRESDVPCQFKILNPNYEEAMKELRSHL